MATRTTTKVTHYHVQKKRRADFIEEWRGYQKTVVSLEQVDMAETARGTRVGVYVGADADRPCVQAHNRIIRKSLGAIYRSQGFFLTGEKCSPCAITIDFP